MRLILKKEKLNKDSKTIVPRMREDDTLLYTPRQKWGYFLPILS
jgi:hypothetical protein